MRISRSASVALMAGALSIGSVALGAFVPRAEACQCMVPSSPTDALAASQAVFTGTVTHRTVVGDVAVTQFVVESAYTELAFIAGAPTTVTVINGAEHCDVNMAVGTQYIVYASVDEATGLLRHARCGRTNLVEFAQEDFAALGAGTPVVSPIPADELSDEMCAAIARLAASGMAIPLDNVPTVRRNRTRIIVRFPWPTIERGPDYYAEVILDGATGEVLEVMSAP